MLGAHFTCTLSQAVSFIRTVTVGSGIAPDLLTPMPARACIGRSRAPAIAHRYRRWGIAPRPENATSLKAGDGILLDVGRRLSSGCEGRALCAVEFGEGPNVDFVRVDWPGVVQDSIALRCLESW